MGDFRFEIWPTEYHVITQHFGVNPLYYSQFGLPGHEGVDIRAPLGSKIFCVAPGEVYRVHEDAEDHNYGVHVRVRHRDGFRTVYGHLQRALVNKGQIVEAGTVLGRANSTGNSFGTHLHFTLKKKEETPGENPERRFGQRFNTGPVEPSGWPREIIDPTPYLLPLIGWSAPTDPTIEGWILGDSIFEYGDLAQVNIGGATLYIEAEQKYSLPAGTLVMVLSKKTPYVRIRVPKAGIGLLDSAAIIPSPEPPPIMATVDGWAWKRYLVIVDKQAVIGAHGVNIRSGPERAAPNVGMVKAGSTVSVLAKASGQFRPVRVRRNDFIEPVALPDLPPELGTITVRNGYIGWVLNQYLSPLDGDLRLTSRFGVNLRSKPDDNGQNMGLVKAFATVRLAGIDSHEYSPVLIRVEDVINVADPAPEVSMPEPLQEKNSRSITTVPDDNTIPGWSFTNGLVIVGNTARTGYQGCNLRNDPRRSAKKIGYVPPNSVLVVTGPHQGEYTPVRVLDKILKPVKTEEEDKDPDSVILGQCRIGLHATLALEISEYEHQEFSALRPGLIKVLSVHGSDDIARLASRNKDAHWIVRAFLSFSERLVTPGQFLNDTIKDVRRVLEQLDGRDVVVELHNEPNTVREGMGSSWTDGAAFSLWWLELLEKYRRALPDVRYLFPGLSPGGSVAGQKEDHIRFIEASREAVEAADGLGVHLYWSEVYNMTQALESLDDYNSRFRDKPLWITEAGRIGPEISAEKTAEQYLKFWHSLQKRTLVQGVAYYIAGSNDPALSSRTWIGKGIAEIIGKR
jgi:hypothetical protein